MDWDADGVATEERGYGESYRRRARRRMLGVAAVALVMVIPAVGLWVVYRQDGGRTGPPPLIRADDHAVKHRPEDPGGMRVPNQDKFIYNPSREEGIVERLLPPPEEPLPSPAAAAPAATPAPPEPTPPLEPKPAPPAAMPEAPPAAPPAPSSPPSPAAAPAQASVASPPPRNPEPAPPRREPAAKAVAGGYRVQLGAVRSEALAQREWERLKHANADLLGKLDLAVSSTKVPGHGTYWRIQAGPLGGEAEAERLCGELKRRHIGCLLVRP